MQRTSSLIEISRSKLNTRPFIEINTLPTSTDRLLKVNGATTLMLGIWAMLVTEFGAIVLQFERIAAEN